MKKIILSFILLFAIFSISAEVVENWVNVYSNDNLTMGETGLDIVVDTQENSYVRGQTGTSQYYDYDAFTQKISPEDETLWFVTYGDDNGTDKR